MMLSEIRQDGIFVALVQFELADPSKQQQLLDDLSHEVQTWVRHSPGFISANFHASLDGLRVFNYAQWRSQADFEVFGRDPRRSGTVAAVRNAEVKTMSSTHSHVVRIITPDG
jgi:C-6 monooxygenase